MKWRTSQERHERCRKVNQRKFMKFVDGKLDSFKVVIS